MEHSQPPYSTLRDRDGGTTIYLGTALKFAQIQGCKPDEQKQIAEHIVHACNRHELLVRSVGSLQQQRQDLKIEIRRFHKMQNDLVKALRSAESILKKLHDQGYAAGIELKEARAVLDVVDAIRNAT